MGDERYCYLNLAYLFMHGDLTDSASGIIDPQLKKPRYKELYEEEKALIDILKDMSKEVKHKTLKLTSDRLVSFISKIEQVPVQRLYLSLLFALLHYSLNSSIFTKFKIVKIKRILRFVQKQMGDETKQTTVRANSIRIVHATILFNRLGVYIPLDNKGYFKAKVKYKDSFVSLDYFSI
jgi:hypothetical protein